MTFIIWVVIGTCTACALFYWIGNLVMPDSKLTTSKLADDAREEESDCLDMSVMRNFDVTNVFHNDD